MENADRCKWVIAHMAKLTRAGHVRVEHNTYIGTDADGCGVSLGDIGYERTMYPYLQDHPQPADW